MNMTEGQNEKKKFVKKDSKYWRSPDEQNVSGLVEVEPEFKSSPTRTDDVEDTDENRREFMKLMGASMALMGAAGFSLVPISIARRWGLILPTTTPG